MSKRQWGTLLLGTATMLAVTAALFADDATQSEGQSANSPPGFSQAPSPSQPLLGDRGQGEKDRPVLRVRHPRYLLRRGDVIELSFAFVPAFNQIATIQPDGYITLRGLGDLHIEGKTLPELTQALQAEYSKILQDPVVAVELRDFEKPYFIAGGELEHPGKYELRSDTTVAEAVAVAGGFRQYAKHSQVLLFRRVSDDWVEVKQVNLKKMLGEANLREDLHLRPGDMLFVPKTALAKMKSFVPFVSLQPYFRPF